MIIIADSGATKCTWLILDGGVTTTLRTAGINVIQQPAPEIRAILAQLPACAAEQVWFYGAGCGAQFHAAHQIITQLLAERFPGARINAEGDLLAAARALFGRGQGIACILGTGSNSCLCRDGEIIANTPPLGYILGDEGSGAALGRELLNGIFKGHIPLREQFTAQMGLSYEQTIGQVYNQPGANRFLASLAPFILANISCTPVREMVIRCFRTFVARNLTQYPSGLPVSLVGGIAAHFEPLVREAFAAEGLTIDKIVESPAQGLVNYHHGA